MYGGLDIYPYKIALSHFYKKSQFFFLNIYLLKNNNNLIYHIKILCNYYFYKNEIICTMFDRCNKNKFILFMLIN